MDPNSIPKGSAIERNPNGTNKAGIYEAKTPDGVKRIITAGGNDGNIQADGLVRLGFKRVGDVPSREELLEMRNKQAAADKELEETDKKESKSK